MAVVRIIEADDDVSLAQASVLLRLVGFGGAADDLDAGPVVSDFILPAGTDLSDLVLIALEGEMPAGMVWGTRPRVVDDNGSTRRSAVLKYVAVHPERQGHGTGPELVEAFCERSRNAGADLVVLHLGHVSAERRTELAKFYTRNGFVADAHGFRRDVRD
jgi:predicted N-acetyltransferase YhbS